MEHPKVKGRRPVNRLYDIICKLITGRAPTRTTMFEPKPYGPEIDGWDMEWVCRYIGAPNPILPEPLNNEKNLEQAVREVDDEVLAFWNMPDDWYSERRYLIDLLENLGYNVKHILKIMNKEL